MPPKDLIKSIQTYARFLDNTLERIDGILARVPAEGATPRGVLNELEEAKASQRPSSTSWKRTMNYSQSQAS